MELCRELGGMTLEEMLDRMSSIELVQWRALSEIEKEENESSQRQKDMLKSLSRR
jgi:hypothetical protein